jgi:hypothetical protein
MRAEFERALCVVILTKVQFEILIKVVSVVITNQIIQLLKFTYLLVGLI